MRIEDIEPGREYAVGVGPTRGPGEPVERLTCRLVEWRRTKTYGLQEYVTFEPSGRVFKPENVLCLWEDWRPLHPPLSAMEALRQIRDAVEVHYLGPCTIKEVISSVLPRVKGL